MIAPKWSLLGTKLNIPECILTWISKSSSDIQCSVKMLNWWLNTNDHASWDDLLRVLELPFVDLVDVAEKLKEQLSAPYAGMGGFNNSTASASPVKPTDSGKKYTCLMIDLIEILPPDSWKKMQMALKHYVDPSSGLYPGEVDPAVYKSVRSVSDVLTSLKKYQLLTPVELGWLKFLVDDVVKCPEASQRIKKYEAATDSNLLLGNVHFASGQQSTEETAFLSCRSDVQPETATCNNLRLAKAGSTSYVGIPEHEAVLQSVSVGSIIFYWRIPVLKARELKLSRSVSIQVKKALDAAKITEVSVMVDKRCDSIFVEDLTVTIDHEVDQKALLNSPVAKPKRKISDVSTCCLYFNLFQITVAFVVMLYIYAILTVLNSLKNWSFIQSRKYWLTLRRKDSSLSYQVEFYPNRQSALRGKDVLQVLSFADITEVRPSIKQKYTVEVLYSSIGYSIGLNCDSEAEKLLKDLQHLLSSHHKLYHAMRRSHCSSIGKLLQVDGMNEHIYYYNAYNLYILC